MNIENDSLRAGLATKYRVLALIASHKLGYHPDLWPVDQWIGMELGGTDKRRRSRYYRDFCMKCGDEIRVSLPEVDKWNYCERCV